MKGEGKEELIGFEVAKLEDEKDLHMDPPETGDEVMLGLSERKIVGALVGGEAGSPIKRFDFLIVEDP